MTATRDRREDLDGEPTTTPWNYRPIVGSSRGLPWWAGVLLALLLSIICVFISLQQDPQSLGLIFHAGYFLGCLLAVLWVQRRSLFGPMVQPPLVLAVTAPMSVLLTSDLPPGWSTTKALILGRPLIDGFPVMAITTAVTVLLGVVRILIQRDPARATADERGTDRRPRRRDDDADRPSRSTRSERPARPSRATDGTGEGGSPKRSSAERPRRDRPADEERPRGRRPRRTEDDLFD